MNEPDDPQVAAAFDSLSDDASEVDAMAALHGSDGHSRRNVRLAVLGSLAAAALVVVGVRAWVGPSPEQHFEVLTGAAGDTLDGTSWVLISGTGAEGEISPVDGRPITLEFEADFLTGNTGCNHYSANYTAGNSGDLATSEFFQKLAGCGPPAGAMESAFTAAMADVDSLSFSGNRLTLTGPSTTLTFRSAPPETERSVLGSADLDGTAWVLVSGGGPGGDIPIIDGWPITLAFVGNTLGGVGPCNDYGARFEVVDRTIALQELSGNDAGCGEPVNAAEAVFLDLLGNVEAIRLDGDELVLFGEEMQLVFQPDELVPTEELVGRLWLLVGLIGGDSTTRPIGQPATLRLNADASLEGSTGCRTLSGSYTIFGSSVNFGTFGAEGDCLGSALAEQDGLVVNVLGDGFTAEISGEELTLTSEDNEGLQYVSIEGAPEPEFDEFTIADLAGTRWTFTEGVGPDSSVLEPVDGFPITLRIALDALRGDGPCTDYFMPLDPDPARFSVDGVESATVDCEAAALQGAYHAALEDVTGFSVSGDFLALHGPSTELNFQNDSTG